MSRLVNRSPTSASVTLSRALLSLNDGRTWIKLVDSRPIVGGTLHERIASLVLIADIVAILVVEAPTNVSGSGATLVDTVRRLPLTACPPTVMKGVSPSFPVDAFLSLVTLLVTVVVAFVMVAVQPEVTRAGATTPCLCLTPVIQDRTVVLNEAAVDACEVVTVSTPWPFVVVVATVVVEFVVVMDTIVLPFFQTFTVAPRVMPSKMPLSLVP